MSRNQSAHRLVDIAPELELLLTRGADCCARFPASAIRRETLWIAMRDGVRLATDVYLPPACPAPAIVVRTPYGRTKWAETLFAFAQHGYVVLSQDCRGTGQSEPDTWDYYLFEPEDSVDLVEWATRQAWFDGFLGACGGSYLAATQWCMAVHPSMSTIVPEVGGLGIAFNSARYYMFLNAYARSVGKGVGKLKVAHQDLEHQILQETLSAGYFNEPLNRPLPDALLSRFQNLRMLPPFQAKQWLWEHCCALPPTQRSELIKCALGLSEFTFVDMEALCTTYGYKIAYGAHSIPCTKPSELAKSVRAPALMITGWYDWGLNDELETWKILNRSAPASVSSLSRLVITPSAHNVPGYHEGREEHPELERNFRTPNIIGLLLRWYAAVRDQTIDELWPRVIYYLMGANEWHAASAWPPTGARTRVLHLGVGGALTCGAAEQSATPDSYTYRPEDPTPTLGGSIVSSVYAPGSIDVSEVQKRSDVLVYTTAPLDEAVDVVGPLRLILFVSSSAVDTDFSARLSDVFPDGRAIHLQSGMLRARYRNSSGDPELLEPGRIYRLEIDMWATARSL